MRLIETASPPGSLKLSESVGTKIPRYAILSHTWSSDEILYQDVLSGTYASRKAFPKVTGATNLAGKEGLDYIWIDTCCIDKTSSAELGEAINSMFEWYRRAEVCYVYLDDVDYELSSDHPNNMDYKLIPQRIESVIIRSRWFTRGWTLQELVAPDHVILFSRQWASLGGIRKQSAAGQAPMLRIVSMASGVAISVLTGIEPLSRLA